MVQLTLNTGAAEKEEPVKVPIFIFSDKAEAEDFVKKLAKKK